LLSFELPPEMSAVQRFRSFARGGRRVRGLDPKPVIERPLIGPQRLEFGSCGFSQIGFQLAEERIWAPDEQHGIMVRIKET
jgi:hypothetical protein